MKGQNEDLLGKHRTQQLKVGCLLSEREDLLEKHKRAKILTSY